MLINLLNEFLGSGIIASFSGAMLFTITQRSFTGKNRLMIFIISFFMGIVGANNTVSIIRHYFPAHPEISRETGSFICSALIVTVSMLVISRVENVANRQNKRGDGNDE
ncbi:putative holin [Pantoea sp. AS142]|uniref:putative holin n=1 Tax=Pantoea sp. AS142 TaxID=3081292 RepID=UPI0030198A71